MAVMATQTQASGTQTDFELKDRVEGQNLFEVEVLVAVNLNSS